MCSPAWGSAPPSAHVLTHTACTHLCVLTHVHAFTCVYVDPCALTRVCVYSPVCTHTCVRAFTSVCVCVHLYALTRVCLCPPVQPGAFSHSSTCSHVRACIYPGVRSRAFTPTHPCAHVRTHAGSHASILPCFHADLRVHTLQHRCPPTRVCARTPLHWCTHSRARVLTRVCGGHPAAGAALAPRLPPPCPRPWGCQAWAGSPRCPGTGRGCRDPLRGAPPARRGPGERHVASKGKVAVPTRATWGQPGQPRASSAPCHPPGTATHTGPPPPSCHPKRSVSDATAVSASYNTTTVTQVLCPPRCAPGEGPRHCPLPRPNLVALGAEDPQPTAAPRVPEVPGGHLGPKSSPGLGSPQMEHPPHSGHPLAPVPPAGDTGTNHTRHDAGSCAAAAAPLV